MPKNKEFRLVASAKALGNRKGEVTVYSAIYPYRWGDDDPTVTSNNFIKALNELDVDEITVRINSPGGVVSEAIAIRTALIKHPATKRIDIEGCCDSAATLIACIPGALVRIAKGGEYMIHRCSGGAYGNADKLLSAYNAAVETDKSMAQIYAERTGKSEDECMALMKAESWFGADDAIEAGFADEIIAGPDEEEIAFAACALDAETMEVMRASYEHAPEHPIRPPQDDRGGNGTSSVTHRVTASPEGKPFGETAGTENLADNDVSNGSSAVAADRPTENTDKGENHMELRDATAEQLRQENPALAETIAQQAVAAERERVQRIYKLTPRGAQFVEMAKKAKAEGTSAEDFFAQVIEAQEKAGEEYLEARHKEIEAANNVGGGDSKDHDDPEETTMKAAKDIAELAKDMRDDVREMA